MFLNIKAHLSHSHYKNTCFLFRQFNKLYIHVERNIDINYIDFEYDALSKQVCSNISTAYLNTFANTFFP